MFWICKVPSWFLALLRVFSFLAAAIGGLLLSRHSATKRLLFSRDINEAVNYFGGAMATLYSVTLGRSAGT